MRPEPVRRFYDLPTGYGAVFLALLGGLVPPVGYMGGKRRLAADILAALGLQPGQGAHEIVLADAGCPGWVWPEILDIRRAACVVQVLEGWRDRVITGLWDELSEIPPSEDPARRAAQVLVLQGRMASNCPLIWSEERGRWEMGDRPRKPPHDAMQRRRAKGKGFNLRSAGGLLSTASVARRVEAIAAAAARTRITFHHGDLFDVIPTTGDLDGEVFYFDPDYKGATSYGFTVPQGQLLAVAPDLRRRGARVGISEAVRLPIAGWHHRDLTRKKPEILTCSWRPEPVQVPLFRSEVSFAA